MAYGSINADVIGTSVQGYSLGAGNSSLLKNKIINGAMVIDQRNAGASVSLVTAGGTGYPTDRWYAENSTSGTATVQQVSDAPSGFAFSTKWTVTGVASSLTSTDSAFFQQRIEGFNSADLMYGTATALTTTVSFWVKSSVTGTFGGAFANSAYNRAYSFTYTISSANTWEQKSITVIGDTTGTWIGATNGIGLRVSLALAAGSARGSTAGSWGAFTGLGATGGTNLMATNGATWQYTGVQLEVGSSATGFEYRQYGQELALCQRYLPAINSTNSGQNYLSAYCQSANTFYVTVPFKVSTRVAPTGVTAVGTASSFAVAFNGSGQGCTTAPTFISGGTESAATQWVVTSASVGMPGIAYQNATGLQLLFTGCEL